MGFCAKLKYEIFFSVDLKLNFMNRERIKDIEVQKLKLVGYWVLLVNTFFIYQLIANFFRDDKAPPLYV